jgi:hypothetical protein
MQAGRLITSRAYCIFNCHPQQSDDPLLSAGYRSGQMMTDTKNDLTMHIRQLATRPGQ